MTKKHFIALAEVLRDLQPCNAPEQYREGCELQWRETLDALADFCARQNPQFDRERWLAYIAGECGQNGGKVRIAESAASEQEKILAKTGGDVEIVQEA